MGYCSCHKWCRMITNSNNTHTHTYNESFKQTNKQQSHKSSVWWTSVTDESVTQNPETFRDNTSTCASRVREDNIHLRSKCVSFTFNSSAPAVHLASNTEERNCTVTKRASSPGDLLQCQSQRNPFLHQAKWSKLSLTWNTQVNSTENTFTMNPAEYTKHSLVLIQTVCNDKRVRAASQYDHFAILIQFCVRISHLWQTRKIA